MHQEIEQLKTEIPTEDKFAGKFETQLENVIRMEIYVCLKQKKFGYKLYSIFPAGANDGKIRFNLFQRNFHFV